MKNFTKERKELVSAGWKRHDLNNRELWLPPIGGNGVGVTFRTARARLLKDQTTARHPDQPFISDEQGVTRFKENRLVSMLLEKYPGPHGGKLNALVMDAADVPVEDWEQLYQLIGYSFSGFQELSRVRDSTVSRLEPAAEALLAKRAKK